MAHEEICVEGLLIASSQRQITSSMRMNSKQFKLLLSLVGLEEWKSVDLNISEMKSSCYLDRQLVLVSYPIRSFPLVCVLHLSYRIHAF